MYAGQNDDQVESGIGGLADQPRIVGCFAGLYLSDDKSFLVDDNVAALWIEQLVQNTVGQIIQLEDNLGGKMLLTSGAKCFCSARYFLYRVQNSHSERHSALNSFNQGIRASRPSRIW